MAGGFFGKIERLSPRTRAISSDWTAFELGVAGSGFKVLLVHPLEEVELAALGVLAKGLVGDVGDD